MFLETLSDLQTLTDGVGNEFAYELDILSIT